MIAAILQSALSALLATFSGQTMSLECTCRVTGMEDARVEVSLRDGAYSFSSEVVKIVCSDGALWVMDRDALEAYAEGVDTKDIKLSSMLVSAEEKSVSVNGKSLAKVALKPLGAFTALFTSADLYLDGTKPVKLIVPVEDGVQAEILFDKVTIKPSEEVSFSVDPSALEKAGYVVTDLR